MQKKIEWHNEKRKLKDLIPWEGNPRQGSNKEEEDLKASINKFSLVDPFVINTDNMIVGGHFRRHLLIKYKEEFGEKEVDVRVPNRKLTEEEMIELNLRLNKNTGSWDIDKLLNIDMETLLGVGFDEGELGDYWDSLLAIEEDGFNLEKALAEIKAPITKEGELWQLGSHRLMCGDSTSNADVEKLMGEERADIIYTDPPYNIGLDYSKGIGTSTKYRKDFPDLKFKGVNDKKKTPEYKAFLNATIKNGLAFSKKDLHIFYWCDENYVWLIQQLYHENGIRPDRICLWVKNSFNVTPQKAFNKIYESCIYGTIGKPYLNNSIRNLNEIMNKEVGTGGQTIADILDIINIWLIKRDNAQDYLHPTQKPLSLNEKPIKRCTKANDIVLDFFGGSGSTLIACDQLKRRAFLMEIDPIFASVILNRYEKHSGIKPKKL